ncbi:hypothetical protein [Pantoea stewartii]|uniref:Endopeptidase n=1 Tax=Pantoea stewartii subsp. stewartii DC283 TaxID=660596 RepID=H3R9R5_PANSE|nr:hypothetical protein [Pantoea stewartii]ARF51377.1 hypothetical protein DSJ_20010 [Pantoea stewartii subsp. stewartii DC283]EHU01928.1 hypothetical protein CKS_0397 [Pantoea stewartii subsp. stewartii DC283]
MGAALIKGCLKRVLPGVLLCALLFGAGWWLCHRGYASGCALAKSAGDVALASEQKARAGERQRISEATTAALLKAQQDEQAQRLRADTLAASLENKTGELAQAKLLLSIQINKAVSDDSKTAGGCGYNGLGTRSMHLYANALGYGDGHTGTGH